MRGIYRIDDTAQRTDGFEYSDIRGVCFFYIRYTLFRGKENEYGRMICMPPLIGAATFLV